ncbi:uncharacterized protein LOC126604769 [Malus sylvestris]|uniref:uncharacterized protein LOC126604769 n=1 Tax=Malus sylvestris TaxID=3752 RepID=UPI0021ACF729|nr:uncharacterized protein LOC126604769 [Malus sylvestris]
MLSSICLIKYSFCPFSTFFINCVGIVSFFLGFLRFSNIRSVSCWHASFVSDGSQLNCETYIKPTRLGSGNNRFKDIAAESVKQKRRSTKKPYSRSISTAT